MEMFTGIITGAIVGSFLITAASMISTELRNIAKAIREQKDKK